MVSQLLRFFGTRALEKRLLGNKRPTGWARYGRLGLPIGGLPMVAYLAWSNREQIASAYRWARERVSPQGTTPVSAGAQA
jgi:hypothetical protein